MTLQRENTPRIVIAGTGSGVGKTSITIGLLAALRKRGIKARAFKVGPDYLDPTWLSAASGETCFNLDGWMTRREYIEALFQRESRDADIAVLEGVMGLFDGAGPDTLTGSTAEISIWLDAPVLLVTDVGGSARSAAAMVKGFADFEPDCRIVGVIANRCGSQGHANIVASALEAAGLPGLVGWIGKDTLPELPGRHLGLHPAHEKSHGADLIAGLAEVCAAQLDLDEIMKRAKQFTNRANPIESPAADASRPNIASATTDRPRIAVARDKAFYFYYPDNLAFLEEAGAELVFFSPMSDSRLPPDTHGLYIGGGYPEEYAAELSANETMLRSVRDLCESGHPVYAECGGLMYLSRALETLAGESHAMAGVLPFSTRMLPRRKMLSYVETTCLKDSCLAPAGTVLRGHEFHYSEIVGEPNPAAMSAADNWERVHELRGRRSAAPRREGFVNSRGNVLAGYVHQHFASHPDVAGHFIQAARAMLREVPGAAS